MALRGVSAECGDLAICWDAEDNLSPKPYDGDWNAHDKDRLENEFKKMVCVDKTITLEEAQREISTEWIAAYKEYIGECNPFAEVKHCKYTNCYSHWRTDDKFIATILLLAEARCLGSRKYGAMQEFLTTHTSTGVRS